MTNHDKPWRVTVQVDRPNTKRVYVEHKHADRVTGLAEYNGMIELLQATGWELYHTDGLPGLQVAHLRPDGELSQLTSRITMSIARVTQPKLKGHTPTAVITDEAQ